MAEFLAQILSHFATVMDAEEKKTFLRANIYIYVFVIELKLCMLRKITQ